MKTVLMVGFPQTSSGQRYRDALPNVRIIEWEADLKIADLKRADLKRADLNLKRADLKTADLKRADLKRAYYVKRADLKRADLKRVSCIIIIALTDATHYDSTFQEKPFC